MSTIKHVAIIMDGNGRWAQARRRPRIWGHVRGSSIVSEIVAKAEDMSVEALTLYAFSTENWSRPTLEVKSLFKILKKFLLRERKKIIKNNINFKVIGDITNLPEDTKKVIKDLEVETKDFDGLKLSFAFSYGGRAEILSAVNSHILAHPNREITEKDLSSNLYRPETGDVDLLIRTGGDLRISNFLLWQCAYAELYFTDTKWPEFTTTEFESILIRVDKHERRFGGLGNKSSLSKASGIAKDNKTNFNSVD
jgi:undecaprenyl diphosphate synthase